MQFPRKIRLSSLILGFFCLLCGIPSFGSAHPKVVLVIADYLSLTDLLEGSHPGISKLVSQGAVGLISSGSPGTRSDSAYATTSAGAGSWGGSSIARAFSGSEILKDEPDSAVTVFERRTGKHLSPGIVQLEMGPLLMDDKDRPSIAMPCALGDTLHAAGKKTAAFGNSDLFENQRRKAAVIASTSVGSVDIGDVSSRILRPERFSPVGFMTDSARLAADVDSALASADFIVVDFGDTTRVELMREQLSKRAYAKHRQNAIKNLDAFLSRILNGKSKDATVMLASIAPPRRMYEDPKRLGPIVIRRPDGKFSSATSSTTRTIGLVSMFDIAPTVLSDLGVDKPGTMIGSSIEETSGHRADVTRLNSLVALNSILLWPVLGVMAAIGIASITAACLAMVFKKSGWLISVLRFMLVFSISSPLAMLFATLGTPSVPLYLVRLFAWTAGIAAGSFAISALLKRIWPERLSRMPNALPLVVMSVATCITLFVDALNGGKLVRFTIINAANFEGFRYYGVGNEYMGVWLGVALISIIWLRECWSGLEGKWFGKVILFLVCFAIVAALGFPRCGVNAGGAVAAVIGLGLIYVSGIKRKFNIWHVLLFTAAAFATVAVIGNLDLAMSHGAPSHIGLAAQMSERQGYSYLATVAARKVSMNLSLLATKQSIAALWGAVPLAIMWFAGIGRRVNSMLADRPRMVWGLRAGVICSVAAFLFNDSGAVAWGLIFGYLILAMLYSVLDSDSGLKTQDSGLKSP